MEATNPGNDPSALNFTITNSGVIPLEHVKLDVAICNIRAGGIILKGSGGCAFQEPPDCKWCIRKMPMDAKHTIDFREIYDELSAPLSARQMPEGSRTGVRMSFQLWFFPRRFERDFPYELKRSNDGHLYWAPADFSFESAT